MRHLVFIAAMLIGMQAYAQSSEGGSDDRSRADHYYHTNLRLQGAIGLENYSFGGTGGISESLQKYPYQDYGAEFRWTSANWGVLAGYNSSSATIAAPSGVSPVNPITHQATEKIAVTARPFAESEGRAGGLNFQLGLMFNQRNVDATSPNTLLSNEQSYGPLIGVEYLRPLNDTFSYVFQWEMMFINFFHDAPTTGNYTFGYATDLKAMLIIPVNQRFDVLAGLRLSYSAVQFNGTGDRGLSNANESTLIYSIPVELVISF